VQARRKEQAQKAREEGKAKAKPAAKKPQGRRPQQNKVQKANKPVETRALNADEVKVGNQVNVNMGKGNMAATIVEINKEDVRVQLSNGLQMVVKAEHLRA
jgi:ProP effector